MRVLILTSLLVLSAIRLLGQCVQQPPPSLDGVSEFACRGMSQQQAWEALTAAGVQPIRPERLAVMADRANRRGRKGMLLLGLRIASMGLPFVGSFGQISEQWVKSALLAAPAIVEGGIRFAQGLPDEFSPTPDAGGFTTIYTVKTGTAIVRADDPPPPAPVPSVPAFIPTSWDVLYYEARERNVPRATTGATPYMNQAEAERMLAEK